MRPVTPIVPGLDLPVFVFGKDQPEYKPLPVFSDGQGLVLSRWKLTLRERLRVFLTGDVYLWQSHYGEPLQPVSMVTRVDEIH